MSTNVFLRDPLAAALLERAGTSPQARALLALVRDGWDRGDAGGKPPRAALRGLAGSSRAYLVAWLHEQLNASVVWVVPHGETYEAARDDIEYFAGRAATLAFPEPDAAPYDPYSPHPSVTAERLETLCRLAAGQPGACEPSRPRHALQHAAHGREHDARLPRRQPAQRLQPLGGDGRVR